MSAAETIEVTKEGLEAFMTERDEKQREANKDATAVAIKEAIAALDINKPARSPVQLGGSDDTRTEEAEDSRRDEMRDVARGIIQTEGWERKAAVHYKMSPNIPEAARELRNPVDDYYMAEWLIGVYEGNTARAMQGAEYLHRRHGLRVDGNLQTGIGALGGDLVPEPFADLVYVQIQLLEVMAPLCMRFTSERGNLTVPKELVTNLIVSTQVAQTTDTGAGGGTDTPAPTLADPKFAKLKLQTHKAKASVLINDELVEQSPFDVVTLVTNQAGKAIALASDDQIVTLGDGIGENHTDSLTTNADIDATTVGTLFDSIKVRAMWGIPISGHKANGIWVTDNAGLGVLNLLEDAGGKVIFTPADQALSVLIGQGQGVTGIGTMLSRPVYEVRNAGGRLFFGDPGAIGVLDDGRGLKVKIEPIPLMDTRAYSWSRQRDSRLLEGTAWARTSVAIAI